MARITRQGYPFESGSLGSCRQPATIIPGSHGELLAWFPDDHACIDYLEWLRWPNGFRCPRCVSRAGWRLSSGRWECTVCGRQTSVTSGTIFHRTCTPLPTWFPAAWLMTGQKQGVSALGLQRALGLGSYQTAWPMLHRFRLAMVCPARERLSGSVEVDEAYVGGVEGAVHGRETAMKSIVAIAVEIKSPKGFWRHPPAVGPRRHARQSDPIHRHGRGARLDAPHRRVAGVLDRARAWLHA